MGGLDALTAEWLIADDAEQEAAVTRRTLNRWVEDGKVRSKHLIVDGRKRTFYNRADVIEAAQTLTAAGVASRLATGARTITVNAGPASAGAAGPPSNGASNGNTISPDQVRTNLQALIRALPAPPQDERQFLTIPEAVALTGIPKLYLARLVRENRIPSLGIKPPLILRATLDRICTEEFLLSELERLKQGRRIVRRDRGRSSPAVEQDELVSA